MSSLCGSINSLLVRLVCFDWLDLVADRYGLSDRSGASIGDGQSAVASNIANTTYRLQWWDFTKFDLPEISNGTGRPPCSSTPFLHT